MLLCFLAAGCDKKSDCKDTIDGRISSSVKKGDWSSASKLLNLHLNMKSSASMHLMNGMVYEKLSQQDPAYAGLSVVAYKRALNLDPNNCKASLAIGKYYLREHDYLKAISAFAKTLLTNENSVEALYGMANAAYATRNITLARNCIDKAMKLSEDKLLYRLAALIYAAENNPKHAELANRFAVMEDDLDEIKYIRGRITDWKRTHIRMNKIKFSPEAEGQEVQKDENKNITVECVILSFDESGSFSKGSNFLETLQEFKRDEFSKGLHVRFGNRKISQDGSAINTEPVYSNSRGKGYDLENGSWVVDEESGNTGKVVKKAFSIGFDSIRYNLNILNSSSSVIDIVSRPVMQIASQGGRGTFESGDRNYVNTGGDVGSAISNIPSGVRLSVESNKVGNQDVALSIDLEINKTIFKNNAGSLNDTASTIHAQLQTQIQAKLNETIVIGGVYSNINESGRSGFPGAHNVPLLDLVLSNKNTHTTKKSVMMMLTPKTIEDKKIPVEIDGMENILLLKEYEPSFFRNRYRKERKIKQQSHEYRRDDIKFLNDQKDILDLEKRMF
ncbi:hypothetical protein [Candidatus Cytomitobacter indipagum]|nr:hypothetical protein [Candidatus Cytomitobacter indipagum]